QQEHDGIIPEWAKGWMAVASMPGGRTLLGSPWYLFSTWVFGEGESNPIDTVRDLIDGDKNPWDGIDEVLGLHPVLDIMTNIAGYRDDNWKPDILGYFTESKILNTIINGGRAWGIWGND